MSNFPVISQSIVSGEIIPTVNARDLHAFLEVGKDFSDWIKAQVERGRLVEGRDFVTVEVYPQKGENSKGGRPRLDYHLTLDAGKHVGMMSGTDKGFEVREYFLACERKAQQQLALPTTYKAALIALVAEIERGEVVDAQNAALVTHNTVLVAENKELVPKAKSLDRLSETEGSLCMREAAKVLEVKPGKLKEFLKGCGWIFKAGNKSPWLGNQAQIDAGFLFHKVTPLLQEDGRTVMAMQFRITAKGMIKLTEMLPPRPARQQRLNGLS